MAYPTTEAFVESAENALGVLLPDWLRSRLIAENGGTVRTIDDAWWLLPVHDTSDWRRIVRSTPHMVGETERARRDFPGFPAFPASAVAIARNSTGDLLILLPAAADPTALEPIVHAWRHGADEPPAPMEISCAGVDA